MVGEEHRHYCLACEGLPGEQGWAANNGSGLQPQGQGQTPGSQSTFAGLIMGMQPHKHALPAAPRQHWERHGVSKGKSDQQGVQLSQPPHSAAPISCGEKWGLTP